ncbi:polysaccharide transporter [Sphingobium lactosutens]|uniref:polysaccharide biosynthesis/export family protein n=1 Tax=Sphingobium lactosutens TaxID=522773 RepID=UPI0015B93972|nr:polysaccharide biosynthesis/export family protein [Sphingobium lactosutens]NWK95840.1 polysaccharide transporter [Sphingobium lactosutens]
MALKAFQSCLLRGANRAALCGLIVAIACGHVPATAGADGIDMAMARDDAQYRINAGDELDIMVWGEERMQRLVRVQPDGSFSFPLAGRIMAAGSTTGAVTLAIRAGLADKYRNGAPDVTVSVRDSSGMRFYVLGKVRNAGSYAAGQGVDIIQALSLAGGLAEFADVKGAVILRQTPEGQLVERVHIARILKGSRSLNTGTLPNPIPVLRSGDVLVIP